MLLRSFFLFFHNESLRVCLCMLFARTVHQPRPQIHVVANCRAVAPSLPVIITVRFCGFVARGARPSRLFHDARLIGTLQEAFPRRRTDWSSWILHRRMTQFPTESPLRWKNRRPKGRTKGRLADEGRRIEGNEAYSPTKACNESLISNSYQTLTIQRAFCFVNTIASLNAIGVSWLNVACSDEGSIGRESRSD